MYPTPGRSAELAGFKADVIGIKEDRVRSGTERWPDYAAGVLAKHLATSALADFFDGAPCLVPLPRSGLSPQADTHWPSRRICEALVAHGIGTRVETLLRRERAVPKSAGSKTRPSPETHYDSFGPVLPIRDSKIILVDDVVTRGATALGAAWRIMEAMPHADVALFAMARTVFDEKVAGTIEIITGTIEQLGENYLLRTP